MTAVSKPRQSADPSMLRDDAAVAASAQQMTSLVELLFFAYRDFVGEPDRVLDRYGFGRAHHRVMHFVQRNPGLTIAALLDVLGITKQSLSRVLRELVEAGHVVQRAGDQDRRQRRLFLTDKGLALAEELLNLQVVRITRALEGADEREKVVINRFLFRLIDPEIRQDIARLSQIDVRHLKEMGAL